MATPHWIGGVNGTWNNTANWSLTQNGAGGAAVPVAGDTVYLDRSTPVSINTNQSIGNVASLEVTGSGWFLAGATSGAAGTAWVLSAPTAINVISGDVQANLAISGSGTAAITKGGAGNWYQNGVISGGVPITATGGQIGYFANGTLGSGKITLSGGASLAAYTASAVSQSNNIDIVGDAALGYRGPSDSVAGALTFSGAINFGSVTRTVTIGATVAGGSDVTLSGALSGTAGFTKAGVRTLTVTNAAHTITGTVNFTAGGAVLRGTGTTNPLTYAGLTYNMGAGTFLQMDGVTGATTIASSFTATDPTGEVAVYNSGITGSWTFQPAAAGGVSGFTGRWTGYSDNTYRNITMTFAELPLSAAVIRAHQYSNSFATPNTFVFSAGAAAGTISGVVNAYAENSGSNLHTITLQTNGTGAINFAGGFTRTGTAAGASHVAALVLEGTNPNVTMSGAILPGTSSLSVTKQSTGSWTLSGANTYTGTTTVAASGGTLVAASNSALGTTGAVTVNTVSTLEIAATSVNKSSSAVTVGGTGDGGNGAIRSQSGTNTFTAANFVLSAATRIRADAGRLTLASAGAVSGAFAVEKTGAGDVVLSQTNSTYTGTTTIAAGKLVASKLANVGAVSSFGQPALANATITMAPGTTLGHEGTTADSTDRIIALNAVGTMTIESSGTGVGAVTLASGGSFTLPSGVNTVSFSGTNVADNTCARTLADSAGGATSISKAGSNKWILSGALTYTGTTSCAAGTLNLGTTNRTFTGAISVSGGTLENSTNTVATSGGVTMTGGTITAEITSTTAVTVNSGTTARLAPTNNANTYTGATAINASGKLEVVTQVDPDAVGAGKVLGNSAVTVGNGGEIITSANVNQRGAMRYGGNITFNSGAVLRIGFAA